SRDRGLARRGSGDRRAAQGVTRGLTAVGVAGGAPAGRGAGGRSPLEYNTRPSGHTNTASYSGMRLMISRAFSGPSTKAVFDIPSVCVADERRFRAGA